MADDEQPRVIASFDNYEGMLEALRTRATELRLAGDTFDEYVGLPRGYTQKVIGIRPVRRLGMTSFGPVLSGLGLRCLLVVDEEATRRLKERLRRAINRMCAAPLCIPN